MARWLFKTDPDTYSWQDLIQKKKDTWDGVSNNLALKHLRAVKKGDEILIYHTGEDKAVIGIARAVSDSYPDPSQKDSKLAVVDVAPQKPLSAPVSLSEIKQIKSLADWELVRMSRLSVMPVTESQWSQIIKMSSQK